MKRRWDIASWLVTRMCTATTCNFILHHWEQPLLQLIVGSDLWSDNTILLSGAILWLGVEFSLRITSLLADLWGPYFTHSLYRGCVVSQPFCPTALRAAPSICKGIRWVFLPVGGYDSESTLLLGNPGRMGGLLGLVVCWLLGLSLVCPCHRGCLTD
jgi:hypothetical protein